MIDAIKKDMEDSEVVVAHLQVIHGNREGRHMDKYHPVLLDVSASRRDDVYILSSVI